MSDTLDRLERLERAASEHEQAGWTWSVSGATLEAEEDAEEWIAAALGSCSALVAVARAAERLSDFLENEKHTEEPPAELFEKGWGSLVSVDDVNAEDELSLKLARALAALDAPKETR